MDLRETQLILPQLKMLHQVIEFQWLSKLEKGFYASLFLE